MAPLAELNISNGFEDKASYTLKWVDEKMKKSLTEENLDEDDLINKVNPPPIMNHREGHRSVKPIVKGSRQRQRATSQPPSSAQQNPLSSINLNASL